MHACLMLITMIAFFATRHSDCATCRPSGPRYSACTLVTEGEREGWVGLVACVNEPSGNAGEIKRSIAVVNTIMTIVLD